MKYEPRISSPTRALVEKTGTIPYFLKINRPTLHWCPDWDFALVHNDGGMEFRACTCAGYHRLAEVHRQDAVRTVWKYCRACEDFTKGCICP